LSWHLLSKQDIAKTTTKNQSPTNPFNLDLLLVITEKAEALRTLRKKKSPPVQSTVRKRRMFF